VAAPGDGQPQQLGDADRFPDRWFDRAMDRGGPKVRKQAFRTVKSFLDRF
jgi:hypothetical protein